MRQISVAQSVSFFAMLALILTLGIITTAWTLGRMPLGDLRGIVLVLGGVTVCYLYAFLIYRIFLAMFPLEEGELGEGSRAEFAAQVNILFYLLLFNSLIRTHFLPVPLMRLVYQALGTKFGRNSYSAGVILDPPLTEMGDNCIIGHDAVLFSHAIEGKRLALARIRLGNNVTIGATAVIMSGVLIGDGAIVSAGAVVRKGASIGAGEIWGGVPAKMLRSAKTSEDVGVVG
jgi:acetyltransferase-like isoleucine patch superfamily enzyme